MGKHLLPWLFMAIVVGVAFFFWNYEFQMNYENGKLAYVKIVPRGAPAAAAPAPAAQPAAARPTFRLASFDLGQYDDAKQANARASGVLCHLFPQFELIAVQGIRGKNQGVLVRLVEQINATSGRSFNFATCPTQQRDAVDHYNAFIYDQTRLDVDRTTVHFVEDRLGRFRVKPLVGVFRARGPKPEEAFTFTLINVDVDPDNVAVELDLLAETYRAVRDDGRNEDDIILLGNLRTDDQHLGGLNKLLGVEPLLSNVPTTVRGAELFDNILLDRRATSEFAGRVEVVDMIREFGLSKAEASEISEHLPIWAEFSVYEGGELGHAATAAAK
jgi:hypothetical protein